jgi:hypothetical protein
MLKEIAAYGNTGDWQQEGSVCCVEKELMDPTDLRCNDSGAEAEDYLIL